jgi:predicted transcriptional regulator
VRKKTGKPAGRPARIYAMYKGEEMLAVGTIREIAEKMGVTIATVRFQATPAYRKRVKAGGVHREVFPIDDD